MYCIYMLGDALLTCTCKFNQCVYVQCTCSAGMIVTVITHCTVY